MMESEPSQTNGSKNQHKPVRSFQLLLKTKETQ